MSEACEIYAYKYSIWFWMGAACVKNYVIQGSSYFMKNNHKTILTKRPPLHELDEKIPEKMRLDQAIRYLENVISAHENTGEHSKTTQTHIFYEASKLIKEFDFKRIFANIPSIIEESKDLSEESTNGANSSKDEDIPYSMGLHNKANLERHNEMTKSAYMLLIYCYLLLQNYQKGLEYCKTLKSDFKLNSKMSFELKMYMTEIYLNLGQENQAFKCLKLDRAFEEGKDGASGDSKENFTSIENTVSGFVEHNLPKRAVMFLNIATCNYLLDIPDTASDAISNALDSLSLSKPDNPSSRKPVIAEIPEYLLHSLVYLNLFNGDNETALKLLRKRRFDKINENLLDFSQSLAPLKVFKQ